MRFASVVAVSAMSFLAAACSQAPAGDAAVSTAPDLESTATADSSSQLAQGNTDVTRVKLTTTKGDILIDVHPDWAPNGAARFLELVENDFYDGVKFFRVVPGFMVQTGMNGDPATHAKWKDNTIPDDKVTQSNKRGFVTFAATGAPNSRSTQFFINFGDNGFLDAQRFAPFGEVVEGMDVVEKINAEYGEQPDQGRIIREGNEYLNAKFPNLDGIEKAEVVEDNA